MDREALLREIDAVLKKTGLSASRFGKDAVSDPNFVFDLRAGRDVRMSTLQKVQTFIAEQRAS